MWGRSLTLFHPRADYVHHITNCPHFPNFPSAGSVTAVKDRNSYVHKYAIQKLSPIIIIPFFASWVEFSYSFKNI